MEIQYTGKNHLFEFSADLFYVTTITRGKIADVVSVRLALERKGYLGRFFLVTATVNRRPAKAIHLSECLCSNYMRKLNYME